MDDSNAIEGTDDNQILPKFLSKVLTICLILSRPIVFCVTFTAIKKIKVQKYNVFLIMVSLKKIYCFH